MKFNIYKKMSKVNKFLDSVSTKELAEKRIKWLNNTTNDTHFYTKAAN